MSEPRLVRNKGLTGYFEMMLENPANPKIWGNKYNRHLVKILYMGFYNCLVIGVQTKEICTEWCGYRAVCFSIRKSVELKPE
jgi:hypothetical protein